MPGLSPTDDYLFGEFSVGAMSTIYGMVNDRIEPLVLRLDEKVQVYSDERTYLCEDGTTYAYQIAQIEGEEDGVRINKCTTELQEIILPAEIDGCSVKMIGALAFAASKTVTSIVCSPNIQLIGNMAFKDCKNLQCLVLPENLDSFDRSWVYGCASLKTLVLPGAMKQLTKGSLKDLPLTRLVVGAHMEHVEEALCDLVTLECMEIAEDNPYLSTDGKAVFSADGAVFMGLAVKSSFYQVPATCKEIGVKAFAYNKITSEVALPAGITKIAPFAFIGSCIEGFVCPETLLEIGEKAFAHCDKLANIQLNAQLESIGEGAFEHSKLESIEVPASLKAMGFHALSNTPLLAQFSLDRLSISPLNSFIRVAPDSCLYVRKGNELHLVEQLVDACEVVHVLPGTVSIGPKAFQQHARLRAVDLPDTLISIGENAFTSCRNLVHAALPPRIESIGRAAFKTTSIPGFRIPATLKELGSEALFTKITMEPRFMEVEAGSDRFFEKDGVLYEKTNEGIVKAVIHMGMQEQVCVPYEASALAAGVFAGNNTIKELRLHTNLTDIDPSALLVGAAIDVVRIDEIAEDGSVNPVIVRFPSGEQGKKAFITTFAHVHKLDARKALSEMDSIIPTLLDRFERCSLALFRLENPIYLSDETSEMYQRIVANSLEESIKIFAKKNYTEGYDRLLKLGFLNEDNISNAIELVSKAGDVAMTGFLLEMKKRHFGKKALDFDL